MAASEGIAERVVAAGRRCSLTTAVLQEWARRGTPRQVEYLAEYLEAECRSRDASKRAGLLRRCALPQPKTFDGYEWGQISWPEGFGRDELLSLFFLDAHEDLVLMGDVGTGKTHMAEALCTLCCQQARPARFFTASSLVMHIRRARRWQARPGAFQDREGGAPGHRRAGVPAARRRRGAAAVPGGLGGI